jgi:hypothetical protein
MKTQRKLFAVPLALTLAVAVIASASVAVPAAAQQYGALERGYRTGYSDGYQAGWNDQARGRVSDHRGKADYRQADRAYSASYGQLEDYSDGYRQGFEAGYAAGYERRGFDSNLPPGGVSRRGVAAVEAGDDDDARGGRAEESARVGGSATSRPSGPADPRAESASANDYSSIPPDAVLTVELLNRLTTDVSQRGDRFEARVVEPQSYAGVIVAGRLTDVQRPGKTRGRALLQLDFEQARLPNGEWADFRAQVVEVGPYAESASLEVDPEGGIRGPDSTRDDVAKVGASAGVGAIIGGIAGGAKGAGIGAVIGAGAGTAGVMNQRGKEIRFEPGQQLKIRAAGRVR